jgi:chorismate lyase
VTSTMLGCADWHRHANGVNPSAAMRDWLTDRMSLTIKLIAHSRHFRVHRLRQAHGMCLADEAAAVGMARRIQVQERDVLLECDGVPVVFAHTIVPLRSNASDWPFFSTLGERSLGTTLFGDPRVVRGALHYARLPARHPLVRRAAAATGNADANQPLFARRCLYRRRKGLLLVTEVFLPAITQVGAVAAGSEQIPSTAARAVDEAPRRRAA